MPTLHTPVTVLGFDSHDTLRIRYQARLRESCVIQVQKYFSTFSGTNASKYLESSDIFW